MLPPLAAAAPLAAAGAPGNDIARAQSTGRVGLICIGDTCVGMPEDGWPIFPDEVEHPARTEPEHPAHTHPHPEHPAPSEPEPEPETQPELEPEPETMPEPESETESKSELRPDLGSASEPEPESEMKPLPSRPEDVCGEGRTLASYRRDDYATWYCEATIPEPVGEPVVWPLEADTEHPSYQRFRTRWLSHPMDVWVGMVFHNPDTNLSGIVTDIVWHDEFNVDRYYVHICVGQPHNFEYFNYAFPEPEGGGLVRMRVDNLITLGPCGAELE